MLGEFHPFKLPVRGSLDPPKLTTGAAPLAPAYLGIETEINWLPDITA